MSESAPSPDPSAHGPGRSARTVLTKVLFCAGVFFLINGILYNEFVLAKLGALFSSERFAGPEISGEIRFVQVSYLLLAVAFVAAALWSRKRAKAGLWPRSRASRASLSIAAIAFSLLACGELCLIPFLTPTTVYRKDAQLGWTFVPGATGTLFGAPVTIGERGLRAPNLPYTKEPGAFRILYVGDSVTFGFMIADVEETYPYLTERILEERTGRAVETVNAGVCGYDLEQSFLYLSTEGIRYDPDLIVVTMTLNDITDLSLQPDPTDRHGRFDLLLAEPETPSRLLLLAKLLTAQREAPYVTARRFLDAPEGPAFQPFVTAATEHLTKIQRFAREASTDVLFVLAPCAEQLGEEGTPRPQALLGEHLTAAGAVWLDTLPALSRANRDGNEGLFVDFWHFGPRGHAVVARQLAEAISIR